MPRRARLAPGGWFYHVLNRANGFERLFEWDEDYEEFVGLLSRCAVMSRMRIAAWCLMPNHWHFLLWPRLDGDLFRFVHRLTMRHTQHWHIRKHTTGRGHLYQARYKSSAIEDDDHLLTVCRYIERNPVRAKLVATASEWPWSSARVHSHGDAAGTASERVRLETLPVDIPHDWERWLRDPQDEVEVERLRSHLASGVPFGGESWTADAAEVLGTPRTPQRRGRPRRQAAGDHESRPDAGAAGVATAATRTATAATAAGMLLSDEDET